MAGLPAAFAVCTNELVGVSEPQLAMHAAGLWFLAVIALGWAWSIVRATPAGARMPRWVSLLTHRYILGYPSAVAVTMLIAGGFVPAISPQAPGVVAIGFIGLASGSVGLYWLLKSRTGASAAAASGRGQ